MGETSGGYRSVLYTVGKPFSCTFHTLIVCLYLVPYRSIKLQSYDNGKIAKTLPNKKRDLRIVGANLHESLTQCTRNIVHYKPAFSFPKSCLEFECELFCRPVGHFSAQFGAHFGG